MCLLSVAFNSIEAIADLDQFDRVTFGPALLDAYGRYRSASERSHVRTPSATVNAIAQEWVQCVDKFVPGFENPAVATSQVVLDIGRMEL